MQQEQKQEEVQGEEQAEEESVEATQSVTKNRAKKPSGRQPASRGGRGARRSKGAAAEGAPKVSGKATKKKAAKKTL